MPDQTYDHKNIKTLSEIEHVQTNPGMYIGEVDKPNHLIYEVLDNALDEANAKHASLIGVFIDNVKNIFTVSDNGRGIPIGDNTIPRVATKLFSGGKFSKGSEGSAYGIAAGLHGIGLVAIAALSDWLEITVYRDDKRAFYRFENSVLVKEEIVDFTDTKPFSTQISFKPSKKYFESIKMDVSPIRERMKIASIHIPHLKLILIVDGNKEIINCNIDDFFKEELLNNRTSDVTPIFTVKKKVKDEELLVKFAWDLSTPSSSKQYGSVNLLSVSQGTHINRVYSAFKNVFVEFAKKEKLNYLPQDCLIGFRAFTSISLYRPEYTSQTKEKLSTSKSKLDHLFDKLEDKISQLIDKSPELKSELLAFFEGYRKSLSVNKNIVKGGKNVSRFNHIIDSKLKDCISKSVDRCELFITEGSSAAGGLVQCRDPKYHAILGLKGKIPNLAGTKRDFLKNKEIVEIVNALGTGIEPEFNIDALRYNSVIISTDADPDGCVKRSDTFVYIRNDNSLEVRKINIGEIIDNPDEYDDQWSILGYNEDNGLFIWTSILRIWPPKYFDRWLEIELEDGSTLSLTHDHLVLVKGKGWIRAEQLQENDDILDAREDIKKSNEISC
jgi:DNA gyrase/topoisomerase IV subunit B